MNMMEVESLAGDVMVGWRKRNCSEGQRAVGKKIVHCNEKKIQSSCEIEDCVEN